MEAAIAVQLFLTKNRLLKKYKTGLKNGNAGKKNASFQAEAYPVVS
jgi:hypothetical protein